jgi:hypothetical protein
MEEDYSADAAANGKKTIVSLLVLRAIQPEITALEIARLLMVEFKARMRQPEITYNGILLVSEQVNESIG